VRRGLIGSILFHIAVIGLLFWNFSGSRTSAPSAPPVAVEMLTEAEFSERRAGVKEAKADKQPVAPAEVNAPEAPPAAPKQDKAQPVIKAALTQAAPPPKQAKAEPPAKAEAQKPEPKKAEPEPKSERKQPVVKEAERSLPAPREEPRKERRFDADKIAALLRRREAEAEDRLAPRSDLRAAPSRAYSESMAALLNRDPDAGRVSAAEERAPWRPASSLQEQAAGLAEGSAARNAASCGDVVRARIERNWDLPFGGLSGEADIVRLRIEFAPDGSLSRPPLVLDGGGSPAFRAVADAAIRAAIRGQPYPIPPDQFDRCRVMNLTFDPRDLARGG
jgi:colicin import membrane protein